MRSPDVGMFTAKGEIVTLSSQTRATSDPYSLKNNFLLRFALHSLLPPLFALLLLWTSRNSTTTFVYLYPSTPFPQPNSRLLPTPNGLSTRVVCFDSTIGSLYQTQQTSDSKSYRISTTTFLRDMSGKTRLLKQYVATMYGLTFALSSRSSAIHAPLAKGPKLPIISLINF